MDRRNFLHKTYCSFLGLTLPSVLQAADRPKENIVSILKIKNNNGASVPDGRRTPFSWPAFGISPGTPLMFEAPSLPSEGRFFLRISVAQEVRDEKLVQVYIPESGIKIGTLQILYSSVLVPCEIELPAKYIPLICRKGLELRLDAPSPLWIFDTKDAETDNSMFLPHVLCASHKQNTTKEFLGCVTSINSVQSFGWREGTVLDGLWQLYALKKDQKALDAIRGHLNLFLEGNNLHYEDGNSMPKFNQINGIESTLPFATLVRVHPAHPMLDKAVEGLYKLKQSNGIIMDRSVISAEGCYTVAYPLAVIGKARNDSGLMQESINQLKHRFLLYNDNALYLRANLDGGFTFRNWARGIAWNLLGFVRTISELKDHLYDKSLTAQFQKNVELAISMQRRDGLWSCFADKKEILPDTSGSAGIAAAILVGVREKIIAPKYRSSAIRCWDSLQQYITPDGLLKGVAQDNRGGVKLQESNYRVISQMGMGLMAQMAAEL